MMRMQKVGTLGAANAAVTLDVADATLVAVQFVNGGSFSGTFTFEVTLDGTNWLAFGVTPVGGGAVVTTGTAAGGWLADIGAFTGFRVRCSAYTSGSGTAHVASARRGG